MPLANDLTTLQAVKLWLQGSGDPVWTSTGDAQLGVYITSASRAALAYMQRATFLSRAVSELRDGTRTGKIVLREYPVTSIESLLIGNRSVPARPALSGSISVSTSAYGALGYVLDPWDGMPPGRPQVLAVDGLSYCPGTFNVGINYTAGYAIFSEIATVPATPFKIEPGQPYGRWSKDIGVTYANGTPLAKIASGTPTIGQYVAPVLPSTLSAPAAPQVQYVFAAADAGAGVLLSYSYVPYDVDQAIAKWVGEAISYRTRIGQKSKALPQGQGTAAYDLSMMPEDVKMVLGNYRRYIPV